MTKEKYMALADFQTLWTEDIKPFIGQTYAPIDSALYPVNVNTMTPSTTFRKNAVVGINGVLYRAKQNTSNLPVVLTVLNGSFVVHTVNGKIAFVVSDSTLNSDWEIFTDASIEYWVESINAALAAKQDAINDLSTIRANAAAAIKGSDEYISGGTTYTATQLLQAIANMMAKTIVVQS